MKDFNPDHLEKQFSKQINACKHHISSKSSQIENDLSFLKSHVTEELKLINARLNSKSPSKPSSKPSLSVKQVEAMISDNLNKFYHDVKELSTGQDSLKELNKKLGSRLLKLEKSKSSGGPDLDDL